MQWHFGPFRLDLDNACLWRGEQRVTLRPKALDILVYLVEHAGTLVIKEALLDAVWPDTVVAEGVLATSMVELRKALGEAARKPQFIATVHRRGYRFIAPVVASDPREPAAMLPDALDNSTLSPVYALQGSSLPRPGRVDQMLRRLAAILSADVQGYSRLMGDDEAATLQTLTTYRALMVARIAQHRGRVVGAPGDNLLAEFASVVDAVQCAVALQREFAERNGALPAHRQMWFRMGINLGEVLVEGDQIYGDGVNIAARLEGIAEGGGICVSGTAYDQIENKLDLTYIDLGEQTVKNIARPIRVYRVQLASAPTTSLAPHESPLAWHPTGSRVVRPARHLVGREAELAQLHACWAQALQGDRQVVFITGEAGIGKTTLVDTFVAQMAHTSVPWVGRGQCIEHYGVGEAYLPLLEAFGGLCRGPEGAHLLTRLTQQAPSWLLQMPALLSLAEYDTLQRRVANATRERMLRELAEAVETLSTERSLVLVLEDLHWSDASTLEWLAYIARRRQPARLLVLGTYRPADAIVHEHPVRVVTQELLVHGQCHQVVVGYLSETHVEAYLTLRLGTGSLSATLAPLLHQRSNGNPLFLITMVEEMVRQGVLHEGTAGWEVAAGCDVVTLEAPESLRHLITQQFEQLPREAQVLLEAASVVGKAFTVAAVAAVIDRPPEEVEEQCTELARRGQWVRTHGTETWPDGTMTARFAFLHDLYREMAYVQVPMSRRARWHQQIGLRLERGYGTQAREMAAELAEHFVRGRDIPRAVLYLEQAGDNARQRSALHEAATHLRLGLELLTALPESPQRMEHELTLLFTLGLTLSMMQGQAAPEVGHVYEQARVLCQQLGDTPRLFHILMGLRRFYSGRGALQMARAVAEQLDELAQRSRDPEHLMEAHFAQGLVSFCLGDLVLCRTHTGRGLDLGVPSQPHTPLAVVHGNRRASCLNYAALALWGLGYADQALRQSQEAVALSQHPPVPSNLAFTLHFAACLRQLRREAQEAERLAAATMALATDYELGHWLGQSTIIYGWAIAAQGQREAGLEQLRQGLAAMAMTGSELLRPYYLALLAEIYGVLGQPTAGLAILEDAWALVDKNSERWYAAELHRLQGVLLLRQEAPDVHQAEQCFQHALHIARTQQARALELRAACSLSQMWQQQGKRDDARQVLAEVYAWFVEGFDTADLQEAKTILETVA